MFYLFVQKTYKSRAKNGRFMKTPPMAANINSLICILAFLYLYDYSANEDIGPGKPKRKRASSFL